MKLRVGLFVLIAFVLAACSSDPDDLLEGIAVTPETATIAVGETETFTAEGVGLVGNADDSVTWTVADDDVDAEVITFEVDAEDPNSITVTGANPGTATLTATSDFDEDLVDTATITVTDGEPVEDDIEAIEVTQGADTIAVAESTELTAAATGVVGTPDESVTWTVTDDVADADVVTLDVDPEDPNSVTVTGVTPGTAVVTATSAFDETLTDSATITVEADDGGDGGTGDGPSFFDEGGTYGGYEIFDQTVTSVDGDVTIDLTVSGGEAPYTFALGGDAEIATVADASTSVTAEDFDGALPEGITLDTGSGVISGTTDPSDAGFHRVVVVVTDANGLSDLAVVEIEVLGVRGIVISPEGGTIAEGEQATFTADVDVQGTVDDTVTWSIAPGDEGTLAIVDGTATGDSVTIEGIASGTASLVATANYDDTTVDAVTIEVTTAAE